LEGITILTTRTEVFPHIGSFILLLIGIIMVVASLDWLFHADTDEIKFLISFLTVGIISILIGTFGAIFLKIPGDTIYEVTIDDSVSMNEFTNAYEVLEQRGQIYVVKEIEE